MKPTLAALTSAIVVVTLAGCGATGDGGGDTGTIRIGVPYSLESLDPQTSSVLATDLLMGNLSEALVDPDFSSGSVELVPRLATEWENDGANTWTFTIREGVTFSNDEPLDADAVVYSYDRFVDPDTKGFNVGFFDNVTDVTAVDDTTVAFTTTAPAPDLPLLLTNIPMVPPVYAEAGGMLTAPVGTGPYEYDSSTSDSLVMTARDGYWDDSVSAQYKRIEVLSRPDASARVAALAADELDLIAAVPIDSAPLVPKVVSIPANEVLEIRLNGQTGVFADPKVREAVVIGTDTETIRTSLFTDEYSASPQCQLGPQGSIGFSPDLQQPEYDLEAAQALLAESSYDGSPVVLINSQGKYVGGDEFTEAVAEQWTAIGLNVDLQNAPNQPWLDALLNKPAGAAVFGLSAYQLTALQPVNTGASAGSSIAAFPNAEYPQVQELIDKASSEFDPAEQAATIQQANQEICDANGFVFLANVYRVYGMQEGIDFEPRLDSRIMLVG